MRERGMRERDEREGGERGRRERVRGREGDALWYVAATLCLSLSALSLSLSLSLSLPGSPFRVNAKLTGALLSALTADAQGQTQQANAPRRPRQGSPP